MSLNVFFRLKIPFLRQKSGRIRVNMQGNFSKGKIEYILNIPTFHYVIRHGLGVRIAGSHPAGPGSIPGVGTSFCQSLFFVDPAE